MQLFRFPRITFLFGLIRGFYMSKQSIAKDTANGVIWGFISRLLQLLVQFLIITILSRLLYPEDFATIGLLSVFALLSDFIIDSGFSQALIRETNVDKVDLSTVFYFNVVLGIAIYLLLYVCSPYIALYFKIEDLERISKVFFVIVMLNSISIVPRTILMRDMSFKKIALSTIFPLILSAIVGILVAYCGWGVYSLVLQMIVNSFLCMVFLFVMTKWYPILVFKWSRIRHLVGFSLNLLITGLIAQFFNNLYTLLIGRFYPQKTLGYYTQAKKIEEIPSLSITTIIQSVSYSSMSQVKDDNSLLKKAYMKILFMNLYIVLPIMFLCYVSCENFVPILLGEKWIPIVPYLRILCLYGALFPLFSVNINILKVKGFGKKVLQQEIVRRSLMLLFIFLTFGMGIEIMLYGWVLSTLISIMYSFVECGKPINYSFWKQINGIVPYFVLAICCALVTYFVNFLSYHSLFKFIIQIILYSSLYVSASICFKLPPYLDIVTIYKNMSLRALIHSK